MEIIKKSLRLGNMRREFARRVVRNLPKFTLNKYLKKEEEISIENFMISEEEIFLSKLIKTAKDEEKVIKIFNENYDIINPRDASFALKSFIIKKNGRNLSSFKKLNKFSLENEEKKFVEKCLKKIIENLGEIEERELNTLLKLLFITNLLPIDKNIVFFNYFRENDLPLNYYSCVGLLEHFLENEGDENELEYISKNLSIVMSYDGFLPNDLTLKMKLLKFMLRSKYSDIAVLTILEDSIKETENIEEFDIQEITEVFESYTITKFKGPDYELIDIFSNFILENTDKITIENVRDILFFCQKLKYSSGNFLNSLGKWIFNYANNPLNQTTKQIGESSEEINVEKFKNKEEEMDCLTSCLYSLLYLDVMKYFLIFFSMLIMKFSTLS